MKDLFFILSSCVLLLIFLFLTFIMVASFFLYIMFLLEMNLYCRYAQGADNACYSGSYLIKFDKYQFPSMIYAIFYINIYLFYVLAIA